MPYGPQKKRFARMYGDKNTPALRNRGVDGIMKTALCQHRFQDAEQHERDDQRNDDIEGLRRKERP